MEAKFATIEGKSAKFYLFLSGLVVLAAAGLYSFYLMYAHGIYLAGMTNRTPWGLQLIMLVFYIGASAGSLVISSLYALFGKIEYKPFARVAVFLAMLFLTAALLSIILDWGRPDRFFNPFQYFNPLSLLTINPFLYVSYLLICLVYLWAMFKEKEKLVKRIALIGVLWAIGVHSGTGAIWGFVPRELYQSPLLPPSFIAAALSSGTALMILVILALFRLTERPLDDRLIARLGKLLAVFIAVVMYCILVENAYRAYVPASHEAELYFLFGGVHSAVFWLGMILMGCVIPFVLLLHPKTGNSIPWITFSSVLAVFGVLCERYLIVIPGQTHPPDLFPNMEITRSVLNEGIVNYSIHPHEVIQALGIVGVVGILFVLGLRFLRLLPTEAKMNE
jgi:Ni/Fe-hydrogenase subunit HybB-like protein